MSFDRPRVARKFVSASLLAAMGAAIGSPAVEAREIGNKREKQEFSNVGIQRPQWRAHEDVIFEMEPMHPWQGATIGSQPPAAKAAKPAPAPARGPQSETAAKESPRDADTAKAPAGVDAKGGEAAKESAQSAPKSAAPETASEEAKAAAPASSAAAQALQAGQAQGGVPAAATTPEAAGAETPAQPAKNGSAPEVTAQNPAQQSASSPVPAPAAQTVVSPDAAAPAQPLQQKAPEAAAQVKAPEKQGEPVKTQAPGVAQPVQAPAPAAAQGAVPAVAGKEEAPAAGAKEQAQSAAPQAASAEPNPDEEAKAYAAMLAQGLKGPTEVPIADRATMWLPAGRVFLEGEKARKLLGIEPASWDDATLGVVLPVASGPKWIAYVDLLNDGYIKDDESKSLDAGNLLAAYRSEVDSQNPGRARLGMTPLEVTGWLTEPSYDAKHHLSSCIGATAQGSKNPDDSIVNCTSFALGRDGAVKIVVSGDEASFAQFKGEAPALVDTIAFDKGKSYEDADLSMDRVAGYGLPALVTGAVALKKLTGAAAAATTVKKVGLFALIAAKIFKAWKLLLAGAALLAAGARLIARKRQNAPEAEVVETDSQPAASAPIWSRIAEGLRARFSRSAPEAAEGGAVAEPQVSQPAAAASEREGGASLLASLRAKLAALPLFNRAKPEAQAVEPELAAAGAVVSETLPAEDKSHGSILSKLASMMRRQGRQPAGEADAVAGEAAGSHEAGGQSSASGLKKFASLMRKQAQGGRVGADVLRAAGNHARALEVTTPGASAKSPAIAAAQADAAGQAAAEASGDDFVDLVEPGDEAAASAAISAREALRKARA
jgi:uncharacterized membrane-anchored protein